MKLYSSSLEREAFTTEMGALYLTFVIFSMCMYETIGQLSLSQNKTFEKNDLLPSPVSGKVSSVLRDILRQETVARFSMAQKIQDLETKVPELKKVNDDIRNETLVLKNNNLKLTEETNSLKNQLNQMNETLQKIGANNVERLAATENMLKTISVSLNKTLETALGDLNESSWKWSQISKKVTDYTWDSSDCSDILRKYPSLQGADGLYKLNIASVTKHVYCDMTTEGGGWTAIQRRQDGSTDFFRTWKDYKQGFGDPSKNYWIGNDAIYELTKNKDQELRVELQSFDGAEAYAQYSTFYVGDEGSKYRLTVSGYSGTAGDSLEYHSGRRFSTKDKDSDDDSGRDCATTFHGAWWYGACHYSNLNGEVAQLAVTGGKYPVWGHWKGNEALQKTLMMIRQKKKKNYS